MQTSVILLHNTGLRNLKFKARDSESVALWTLKYAQVYKVDKSSELSVLWNSAVYLSISILATRVLFFPPAACRSSGRSDSVKLPRPVLCVGGM